MNPFITLLAIFLGGGLGACCRFGGVWAVSSMVPESKLPLGLLIVNLLGSLAIGLAAGWLLRQPGPTIWQPLLVTGFLGGFTTFSSFSLDNADLLRNGEVAWALANIAISVTGGLLLAAAGFLLTYRGS